MLYTTVLWPATALGHLEDSCLERFHHQRSEQKLQCLWSAKLKAIVTPRSGDEAFHSVDTGRQAPRTLTALSSPQLGSWVLPRRQGAPPNRQELKEGERR